LRSLPCISVCSWYRPVSGVLVVPPVVTQAQHFVDDAPRYAKDVTNYIERNRTPRNPQRKYDIGGQLQKKAGELPGKIASAASVLAEIGLGVVNSVFAVVTILILAAFMLAGALSGATPGFDWCRPMTPPRGAE